VAGEPTAAGKDEGGLRKDLIFLLSCKAPVVRGLSNTG